MAVGTGLENGNMGEEETVQESRYEEKNKIYWAWQRNLTVMK
jgi:hypothetical protein